MAWKRLAVLLNISTKSMSRICQARLTMMMNSYVIFWPRWLQHCSKCSQGLITAKNLSWANFQIIRKTRLWRRRPKCATNSTWISHWLSFTLIMSFSSRIFSCFLESNSTMCCFELCSSSFSVSSKVARKLSSNSETCSQLISSLRFLRTMKTQIWKSHLLICLLS